MTISSQNARESCFVAPQVHALTKAGATPVLLCDGGFRRASLLGLLAGRPVSVATVLGAEARSTAALSPIVARVRTKLARSPAVHLDETGFFSHRLPHLAARGEHHDAHPLHAAYGDEHGRGRRD